MTKLIHIFPDASSTGFVRGQLEYMTDRGFEIEIISSPSQRLSDFAEASPFLVHEVPMRRDISPLQDMRSIMQLAALIRERKPEIVHANTVKGGFLGITAAALAHAPIRVYHQRGFSAYGKSKVQDLMIDTVERSNAALATRVFCVGHSVRDDAVKRGLWKEEKTRVFAGGSGNGVDANGRFNLHRLSTAGQGSYRAGLGIPDSAVVLGFVGRLASLKGIPELQEVWGAIREQYPNTYLLIVGEWDEVDTPSQVVQKALEDDNRVILTGRLEDPAEAYSAMDVFVFPSHREGVPNVVLEASAMELPIVTTTAFGCIDAVQDGVTGTLVPVRDAEALAAAIQMYLDNPDLRRQHGLAGRERVLRDFRQEVIWEAVYQEYCRLLEEKGLPIPAWR